MGALDTARQPLVVFACIVDTPYAVVVRASCIGVAYRQRRGACWLVEPEFARDLRLRVSRR